MTAQPDLFAAPLLSGLSYAEALVDEREEAALLAVLAEVEVAPFRFQGWIGKRQTTSFGWRYDFDNVSFRPTEPVPDWLLGLRETAGGGRLGEWED